MAEQRLLDITIVSPERMIFEGQAPSVILPGENGVFEVLPFHKRLLSRLLPGYLVIGQEAFPIKRGVAKVGLNSVTIIVEEK